MKRFVTTPDGEVIDLRTGLPFGIVETETGLREVTTGNNHLENPNPWHFKMENFQKEKAIERGHQLGYYTKKDQILRNIEVSVCDKNHVHIDEKTERDILNTKE